MKFVKDLFAYIDGLPPRTLVMRTIYLITAAAVVAILCASLMMRKILADIPSVDKLDEYTPSLNT